MIFGLEFMALYIYGSLHHKNCLFGEHFLAMVLLTTEERKTPISIDRAGGSTVAASKHSFLLAFHAAMEDIPLGLAMETETESTTHVKVSGGNQSPNC